MEIESKIAELADAYRRTLSSEHPYYCYRWNGRAVFRFPVTDRRSAVNLCERLNVLRKQSSRQEVEP